MTDETTSAEETAAAEAAAQAQDEATEGNELETENTSQGAPEEGKQDEAAASGEEAQTDDEKAKQEAQSGYQKRISQLVKEREDARREKAALQAILDKQNERAEEEGSPDFKTAVEKAAADLVRDQRYNEEVNAIVAKGRQEFPTFDNDVATLRDTFNVGQRREFMEAIGALDNGAAVLRHLGQNVDEAAALLDQSPSRMAISLAKISGELAKPKKKPISNAPIPPEPIAGRASPQKNLDQMGMDEFGPEFLKQLRDYAGR